MSRERSPFNTEGSKREREGPLIFHLHQEWSSLLRTCKTGRGWERTAGHPVRQSTLNFEAAPVKTQKTQGLSVPRRISVGYFHGPLRLAAPSGLSSTWSGTPSRLQPLCSLNLPKRPSSADNEDLTSGPKMAEVDMAAIWAPGFTMLILPHSSGKPGWKP